MVSGETFNTSAVSTTLSPPKKRNSTTRLFRSSILASASSASSRATRPGALSTGKNRRFFHRHALRHAAAFHRITLAGVIHKDAPRQSSRNRKEARAALPLNVTRVNQSQVSLIDKRRSL